MRAPRAASCQSFIRRSAAVAAALATAAACLTRVAAGTADAATLAAAATRQYVVVQSNVEKKGFGADFGNGTPENPGLAIDYALNRADNKGADGMTLQEVCVDQYNELVRRYPSWTIAWHPIGPPGVVGKCGAAGTDDDIIGNVAIWRGGNTATKQIVVYGPDPDGSLNGLGQGMACVKWPLAGSSGKLAILCSAHLPAEPNQQALFDSVQRTTNVWTGNGHLVMLGGDFNKNPLTSEMDRLYSLNGSGRFNEADQTYQGGAPCRCGRNTTADDTRKIDYVFFSRNRVGDGASRSMNLWNPRGVTEPFDLRYSDHKTLSGQAVVNLS